MWNDSELFDILNEKGEKTGQTMPRGEVHRTGALHGSVHIWVIGTADGKPAVLTQKRADDKDSFPGRYDAAATGHVDAGEEYLDAAVREIREELGVRAKPSELVPLFTRRVSEDNIFHSKRFINNELVRVYLYRGTADSFFFERSEISSVEWFGARELSEALERGDERFCIDPDELKDVLRCAKDLFRYNF